MKKLFFSLMTALLLLPLFPGQLEATTARHNPLPTTTSIPPSPEASILLARLDEIHAMDIKSLGSAEKKQLRKEVRAIRNELKADSRGVYLSVGAIVIIILLLILLL